MQLIICNFFVDLVLIAIFICSGVFQG